MSGWAWRIPDHHHEWADESGDDAQDIAEDAAHKLYQEDPESYRDSDSLLVQVRDPDGNVLTFDVALEHEPTFYARRAARREAEQ